MRTERDLAPEPRENRRRFMIAGEHVILRAFEREDAERCYRWMNDPNIVRTLMSRYPIAFSNEVEWLALARDFYREGAWHDIVIFSIFREVHVD